MALVVFTSAAIEFERCVNVCEAREDFLDVVLLCNVLLMAAFASNAVLESLAFEPAMLADIDKRPLSVTIAS
jgi:hypothetical protein